MPADRRKEMKQALQQKTQDSFNRRDDTGMYGDIFEEIEGLQKWKCKEGQHIGDIIPYKAGNRDPNTKEGQWTYVLDIWVHGNVGVNQDSFVCPSRNYNQPCPICEYREELRNEEEYDEDVVKSLYPKRRSIYNWLCYDDPKEEAKGIQVWDVAHFFMEKKLMAISKVPARGGAGGGYVAFADPDEGRSIQFERKGSKNNTEFLGHQFVPREGYTITDEVLGLAHQLDQIIHIPDYEELYTTFFGKPPEKEEDRLDTTKLPPVEDVVEAPTSKPTRLLRRGEATPPVGEEKPPVRGSSRLTPTPQGTCPVGGTFGTDCEDLEKCGDCEAWDDCSTEKDKLDKLKVKEETPKPTRQSSVQKPVLATRGGVAKPITVGRRGPIGGRKPF